MKRYSYSYVRLIQNSILFLFLLATRNYFAQQNSLLNTYLYDPFQLNVAYAASSCIEADMHYRTQWIGIKDAPKLLQLNAHTPIGQNNGIGLKVISQTQGLLNMLQS